MRLHERLRYFINAYWARSALKIRSVCLSVCRDYGICLLHFVYWAFTCPGIGQSFSAPGAFTCLGIGLSVSAPGAFTSPCLAMTATRCLFRPCPWEICLPPQIVFSEF